MRVWFDEKDFLAVCSLLFFGEDLYLFFGANEDSFVSNVSISLVEMDTLHSVMYVGSTVQKCRKCSLQLQLLLM